MPATSYDFLSAPKPHHHVSRLIVLLVILAGVMLVAWLYGFLLQPRQVSLIASPSPSPTGLTDVQREAIMAQPSGTTVTTMTVSEEAAIAGKKTKVPVQTSLTTAQRQSIMLGSATMTNF